MAAKRPQTSRNTPEEPPKKALYTLKLDDAQIGRLDAWCRARGWETFDVDHARFAWRGDKVNVVAYTSGKLVVSGKGTEDFVTNVLEPEITGDPRLGYDEVHHPEWFEPHAGLDESGKGDFFGPLVSGCVVADGPAVRAWLAAGVKDSKRLGDREIERLDRLIRGTAGVAVQTVVCGMERYNELMGRPRANLNKLLAWLHARCLEQALAIRAAPRGLLDQFSTKPLVQEYLRAPEGFTLEMRPRAESDPVVAAASIVARAEYVRQMHRLSHAFGLELARGASATVREQARRIIDERGARALASCAKLHFRTAYEVVAEAGKLGELPLAPPRAPVNPEFFRKRARRAEGGATEA